MNRRFFLRSGSVALASFGLMEITPSFLQRALATQTRQRLTGGRRKTLIAIFQRGAVDGLNMIVPYSEGAYYDLRPGIAIPKPQTGNAESAIKLDGFFGLHPYECVHWNHFGIRSAPWLSFTRRVRPITHAPHFDAQDYMESATPGRKGTPDGWLNRYLQSKADPDRSLFGAVSITQNTPRAMQGKAPTLAISNLADFAIRAGKSMRVCKVASKRCMNRALTTY